MLSQNRVTKHDSKHDGRHGDNGSEVVSGLPAGYSEILASIANEKSRSSKLTPDVPEC
jgi:hypothetical protein